MKGMDFFCLYFHLYVNPSPDLGWGLRDSSVRLVNAFARTYSDGGEKLIRPCSPEAIYHFWGVAVCRCVWAPEPFQFFPSLPFKKLHLTAILQIQETKEKATGKFLTLLTWTSRQETGDFFSGDTGKMQLVRFQLRPFWVEFASLYVWCGWLFVSRNWPSPALTLSQPGSWLY